MTNEALKFISDELEKAGVNYEFGEYTAVPTYPYFVGEYSETEPVNEDGLEESTMIISGFSRDSWLTLAQARETIKRVFNGKTAILESGSGIAIWYSTSNIIETGDYALKRIDVMLTVKEWRIEE